MARPTKLTPERHQRIVLAIRAGAFAEVAARAAGIGPATYYRWLDRGRADQERIDEIDAELDQLDQQLKPLRGRRSRRATAQRARLTTARRSLVRERNQLEHDDAYREFWEAVSRASDEAEVAAIAQVRSGAQGEHADWRAAAWFLERRFPDRWRRRTQLEHTGSETAPVRSIVGVDVAVDSATPEQLADAAHDFLARLGSPGARPAAADGG